MKKISLTWFELGSLIWIGLAFFLFSLALTGLFYAWLGIAFLIFTLFAIFLLKKKEKLAIKNQPKKELVIILGLLCLGIFLSASTTPTIFGGRDEGSFSNAAIMLADDHSLKTSSVLSDEFFKIYGPGKALNFPGFIYTQSGQLKSQFLPGYTSWVAFWYGTFGTQGIKFANLLPFVTFLFSFYLVCKKFTLGKNFALAGLLLLTASIPTIVLFKFTLTELFFASLIWLSLHFFLEYFDKKSFPAYVLIFLPLLLTPFVRIESAGMIFALFCLLLAFDFKNLQQARYQFLFLSLGILFALAIFTNAHFFVDSFKNFFEFSGLSSNTPKETGQAGLLPDDWQNFFLPKVLFTYNLLPVFLLGLAAIAFLIKKKNWNLLVPLFFFLPTLVYLIDANISLDHPWMLRRFAFSIIPLFILYSIFLLSSLAGKFKTFAVVFVVLLILMLAIQSFPFATFSQNKGLLEQTQEIAQPIRPDDLLLVGQQASGNGWSLLSEPLRNIQNLNAVYFFNPNDLSKIERSSFSSVYLLLGEQDKALFEKIKKEKISDYQIKNYLITTEKDPGEDPSISEYATSGTLYKITD